MENNKVLETFNELFKAKENQFCFECGTAANEWASVNNGIFLCSKCASIHRTFGLNISAVRSVTNDIWSDIHLAMMSSGGNTKLKDYFEKYHLPKDGPIDYKYRTKAGFHYRKMLRAASEGVVLPDTLDSATALKTEDDINPNIVPDFEVGYETGTPKSGSGLEKMYGVLEETFDQTVGKTKEVANLIGVRITSPELKQSIKSVGDKIAMGAKKGLEEAKGFWRKLSRKNIDESPVHIEEDQFEVVFSAENPSERGLGVKDNKGNVGNIENMNPNA